MADQSYYSPSFKKPCDILRMRRRKRARSEAESRSGATAEIRPFIPGPQLGAQARTGGGGGGVKRRNPFASIENTYSSPRKKRSCEEPLSECGGSLTAVCEGEKPRERNTEGPASLREILLISDSHTQRVNHSYLTLIHRSSD